MEKSTFDFFYSLNSQTWNFAVSMFHPFFFFFPLPLSIFKLPNLLLSTALRTFILATPIPPFLYSTLVSFCALQSQVFQRSLDNLKSFFLATCFFCFKIGSATACKQEVRVKANAPILVYFPIRESYD